MKKLIRIYRQWRYRRLYARLFHIYAQKSDYADFAGEEAAKAFHWHTGEKWSDAFNG